MTRIRNRRKIKALVGLPAGLAGVLAIALVATIWAATGGVKVAESGGFTVGIEGSGWIGLALILAGLFLFLSREEGP